MLIRRSVHIVVLQIVFSHLTLFLISDLMLLSIFMFLLVLLQHVLHGLYFSQPMPFPISKSNPKVSVKSYCCDQSYESMKNQAIGFYFQ